MGMGADIASWILIGAGSLFVMVGGIGVLRLPDIYTRMHAAGVTDTMGAGLMMVGLMVEAGPTLVAVKLGLILIFGLFTSPTATHALAYAAYSSGVKPELDGEAPDPEDEPSKS